MNGGKNEWCLWRVGCVVEVHEWRTEVTKIDSTDIRMIQVEEKNERDSLNKPSYIFHSHQHICQLSMKSS